LNREPGVEYNADAGINLTIFDEPVFVENSGPNIGSDIRVFKFTKLLFPASDKSVTGVVPTDHCGIVSVMLDIILSSDFALYLYTGESSFPEKLGIPPLSKGVR